MNFILTIPTNYNKKMDCEIFIHIQKPLETTSKIIFEIKTADNSHGPVTARIIDSVHQPLRSLSAAFIYLSHGISAEEFRAKMKVHGGLKDDDIVAVYFYQKQAA